MTGKALNHVIISGGNRGIGLGLAEIYLHRGATVSVIDLELCRLAQAKMNCAARSAGSHWAFFSADIGDAAAVSSAVEQAVIQHGRPQLAINSAGMTIARTFATTSADHFEKLIRTNLIGSQHFASSVLPHLGKGDGLALMASMAGLIPNYGYSAYAASKFGVVGLAQVLRCEYADRGIRISCICPPEIDMPMARDQHVLGDPATLTLQQVAGRLPLHDAVQQMVRGLDRGKAMIIPGRKARLTALASRMAPRLFATATLLLVRRLLRRQQQLRVAQEH